MDPKTGKTRYLNCTVMIVEDAFDMAKLIVNSLQKILITCSYLESIHHKGLSTFYQLHSTS